jgi:hypothetical protein
MNALKMVSIALLLALTSCAGMQEAWEKQNCNYNSAYENGSNEREGGKKMDSSMYQNCPDTSKNEALKGYRDGYENARKAEVQTTTGSHIQIGGTQINIPGRKNDKAYFCSIQPFTQKYEAFGATKLEATKNVQALCKKTNSEMHCEADEVECVKNK